jgi:hypothetical protein
MAMWMNRLLPTRRKVLAASAATEVDGLAPHWAQAPAMRWQPPRNSIVVRQIGREMWEGICKELREIAWLASVVGGLSLGGVTLALVLVQP